MSRLGMKGRVLLTLVTVTVLAVASFSVVAWRAIQSRDRHVELLELRAEATMVGLRLTLDPGPAAAAVLPAPEDDDHRVAVYDGSGSRGGGTGPALADPVVRAALRDGAATGSAAGDLVAAEAVRRDGQLQAVVRVAESTSVAAAKTAKAFRVVAAFAAAIVAASAAIGWLLMRSLTSRLDHLQVAAVRIGNGDFAAPVPPTGVREIDRVGRALGDTARRLGSLVERERTFSAAASHQLRTPLASFRIAIESELLAPQVDRSAILRDGLTTLDRLDNTVTSLLQLARGKQDDRSELDLAWVATLAAQRWRPRARQAGRVVRVAPAAGEPMLAVKASSAAVDHVLDVLVDNALMHGVGTVTLCTVGIAGGCALRVSDEGTLPEDHDALFLPRAHGGAAGRGIGLALARTLAAAEGAHLRVLSRAPTAFEVVFALDRTEADREQSAGVTNG